MKNSQIAILLVALAGIVGVVTYVTNFAPPPPVETPVVKSASTAPGGGVQSQARVMVPQPAAAKVYETELFSEENRHTFWFTNTFPNELEVGVSARSCVCSDLQVGVFKADELTNVFKTVAAGTLSQALGGSLINPLNPAFMPHLMRSIVYQPIAVGTDETVRVPGASDKTGPIWGLVRFSWKASEPGPKALTATLSSRPVGATSGRDIQLSVNTNIRRSVLVAPPKVELGDILPNTERKVDSYLWSTSREEFKITKIVEKDPHPCVTFSLSPPLTGPELADLPVKLGLIPEGISKLKSAYKVTVIVRENNKTGEKNSQLDLGPLAKLFIAYIDLPNSEPISFGVYGMVRGELRIIGNDDDKDMIALGLFQSDQGRTKTVNIISTRTDVKLMIDPASIPDKMKATLNTTSEPGTYKLQVVIDPNKVNGPLPNDTALLIKTSDNPPRSFRIPVKGMGYRR